MIIELGKCRIIRVDDMNLSVEQYKKVGQSKNPLLRHEGEKHKWVHIGFYDNIHHALKKIVNTELTTSEVKSAENLISKIDKLYSKIGEIKL